MPFAYGTPSDELGPESDTLSPTLRSAAIAPVAKASARAAPGAQRTRRFMVGLLVVVRWSGEELDRGKRRARIEKIDALEPDAPFAADLHEAMRTGTGEHQLPFAARLDVDEGRAQLATLRLLQRHGGGLQHVLATAGRMLRMRSRVFQPRDAQLQQQAVFVGERVVRCALLLRRALQRHPVAAVVGEQREPFVVAALVEQARFVDDEFDRRHRVMAPCPAS